MSWGALPLEVRATAERVLTEKQLIALKLWENGAGYRRIGLILDISMSTARGRVTRAKDTLRRAIEEDDGHIADSLRRTSGVSSEAPAGECAA